MTLTVDVMSVLATFTGFLLLIGPAPDAKRMHQTRTTGATPFVPLAAMFSCRWICPNHAHTHQSRASVTNVLGYAGNVAVFIFFAAPFENVALVVRHRTGLFIPITIGAATFLNAVVWLVYRLLTRRVRVTRDWLIFVPNVGALVIGGVQIGVYAYFYPGTHPLTTGTISTTATAMGMGSPSDLEAARPSVLAGKVYTAVTSPQDGNS